jgi:hypothetical protein
LRFPSEVSRDVVKAERRRRESVFSFDFVEVFRRRKRASVGVGPERLERGAGEESTSERRTVSFRKKEPAVASKTNFEVENVEHCVENLNFREILKKKRRIGVGVFDFTTSSRLGN